MKPLWKAFARGFPPLWQGLRKGVPHPLARALARGTGPFPKGFVKGHEAPSEHEAPKIVCASINKPQTDHIRLQGGSAHNNLFGNETGEPPGEHPKGAPNAP